MMLKQACLLVFLTGIAVSIAMDNLQIGLMSFLYAIVASYLFLFQKQETFTSERSIVVSPIGIALLALTVYLPLSALPLFLGIKLDDIRPISDNTFFWGICFFLIGVMFFLIGFQLNLGWVIGQSLGSIRALRFNEAFSIDALRRQTWVHLAAGLACYGLLLLSLGYINPIDAFLNMVEFRARSTSQGLAYLTLLTNSALALPIAAWFCIWFEPNSQMELRDKYFFVGYFLIYCLIQLTFGARGPFLALMILAGVTWYLKRGKISVGYIALGAAGGSVLVVLLGFFRNSLQTNQSSPEVGLEATSLTSVDTLSLFLASLFARFDSFRRYLEIVDVLSSGEAYIDYLYGQPFLALLLSPIPRSILPDKPWLSSSTYTQMFHPQYAANSIYFEISLFGEAYLNFGLVGIIGYCFFVGILVRSLQSYFSDIMNKPAKLVFYVSICLFPLGLFQAGICEPVMTGAIFVILYTVWFINRLNSLTSIMVK